jgi:hypothetical protein
MDASASRALIVGSTAALVLGHITGATRNDDSAIVPIRAEWPVSPNTEAWIAKNATSVVAFENVLKNAPYVLPAIKTLLDTIIGPGKLPDSSVANAGLATFTDLLCLVNTVAFARYYPVKANSTVTNSYVRGMMQQSRPYAQMAILMAIVIAFERYAEVKALKTYGEESRWNIVLGIEAFKYVIMYFC